MTFPHRRLRVAAVVSAVVIGVAVLAVATVVALAPRPPVASTVASVAESPATPDYALPVAPPRESTIGGRGVAELVDGGWVAEVSDASGIPARALAAYAGAALAKSRAMPTCGVSWATLAGIGAIESDHGRHGGSTVGPDGTVSPPIFGIALDGDAVAHIPDSDGGTIDSDAAFDRAVGPLQLIPQTWRNWHTDGNGDGIEDPHNIDDAVVATSNYLCRASGDMVDREGWRAGVLAFNDSTEYAQSVANAANRYATGALDAANS